MPLGRWYEYNAPASPGSGSSRAFAVAGRKPT